MKRLLLELYINFNLDYNLGKLKENIIYFKLFCLLLIGF